ncbi:MAG: hypothetical protein K0U93_04315 [Gammaproteobacteria bacterium]|nr:hypothetical protein [Gammaproteobacteria bacterium]
MTYAKIRSLTEGRIAQLKVHQMVVGAPIRDVDHRLVELQEYLRRLDEIASQSDTAD